MMPVWLLAADVDIYHSTHPIDGRCVGVGVTSSHETRGGQEDNYSEILEKGRDGGKRRRKKFVWTCITRLGGGGDGAI